MARITVEDCLEVEPNRFQLVHMAIVRAKQLLRGSNNLIGDDAKQNKAVVSSLREIAAHKVRLMTLDEMAKAKAALEVQEEESSDNSLINEADKILSRLGLGKQNGESAPFVFDDDGDSSKDDDEEGGEDF